MPKFRITNGVNYVSEFTVMTSCSFERNLKQALAEFGGSKPLELHILDPMREWVSVGYPHPRRILVYPLFSGKNDYPYLWDCAAISQIGLIKLAAFLAHDITDFLRDSPADIRKRLTLIRGGCCDV